MTATIVATADSWRDIPADCHPCHWDGPFPQGDVLWLLKLIHVSPHCPVHASLQSRVKP
jgi:hypothetical protein